MIRKILFLCLLFLIIGKSVQAITWSACTPMQLGPYGDIVRIQVTNCNIDPSDNKNGWITLNPGNIDAVNQMMATILTAMTMKKPIAVAFDNEVKDTEGYNIISALIFNAKGTVATE